MPGSWPQHELPNLTNQNCVITSPASRRYNCIAWAAQDTLRWWWPDPMGIGYWPQGINRVVTTESFLRAYGTLGFSLCFDGTLAAGIEKVAIYGKGPAGTEVPTHAALQLENGQWTSKIGPFEDISHETSALVNGPVYGAVICHLARRRPAPVLP
jgi:hypothetical protein